jgi:hypothetical protein
LVGGKPLDEAIANDEVARSMVYKAADRVRMKSAAEKFKTNVIDNPNPEPKAIDSYMESFVHNGGRAEDFNKTMMKSIVQANTPRANMIMQNLRGPYAEHMKSLMSGSLQELTVE